ncbi:phosphoglycolate phosphatase [Oleisolibacter albus]|uniref:phosphoglycolate phosphatase n=1 Tax=Oleisolibacter albus TaxID=2171757 RepID=UPI000DF47328|nr:phosphoglycolate phosphatase [Oleisolibacter albus]
MPCSALDRFPAVLFDLDGTLIDSADEIGTGLNALLAEYSLQPVTPTQVRQFIGDGAPKLVERGFAANGVTLAGDDLKTAVDRFVTLYADVPTSRESLYPGVPETLRTLAADGHRLGLCTNKPSSVTRLLLTELGLSPLFGAVVGGDTLAERKPSPAPLLWAMERLGQTRAGAVMVGDNANDVAAARAAGIPVIAVAYGYPRMPVAELGADLVIEQFAALPEALARLAAG